MATQINDSYATDGSGNPITIDVQTGYAQNYVSSVTLNGNPVIVNPPADANGNYAGNFRIPLGSNAALSGMLLEVTTEVAINMAPPASSILITLTGGVAARAYTLNDPGAGKNPGDTLQYYASIALT